MKRAFCVVVLAACSLLSVIILAQSESPFSGIDIDAPTAALAKNIAAGKWDKVQASYPADYTKTVLGNPLLKVFISGAKGPVADIAELKKTKGPKIVKKRVDSCNNLTKENPKRGKRCFEHLATNADLNDKQVGQYWLHGALISEYNQQRGLAEGVRIDWAFDTKSKQLILLRIKYVEIKPSENEGGE